MEESHVAEVVSRQTKIPVSRGCYASLNQAFLQFYRPNAF